jgi:multimeric flavodoxin WrbA
MKVLLVNGSPNEKGCTYTALNEVALVLNEEGIETEIFWIGNNSIAGCFGCGICRKIGRCCINDNVNEFSIKAAESDGFIIGSPVYYASISGQLKSFLDRVFYSIKKESLYLKPGAGIVSARRAGTTSAKDEIDKYFSISEMPIVSSVYWNMVHGNTPKEVIQDEEGISTLRILARNMAFLLKCIETGKNNGVALPKKEERKRTNFIR